MKTKFLLASFLLGMSLQNSFAATLCQTHEICPANTDCACTVSADSIYTRSFYFDMTTIQKNKIYECQLIGNEPQFILNQSTLPPGSKLSQCSGNCSDFPVSFELNTYGMTSQQDTMILKYSVPPSDIPSDVGATCKEKI